MTFGVVALLTACACVTRARTREVEAWHPPAGRFVHVDDVRLHYADHGPSSAPVLPVWPARSSCAGRATW